MNRVTSTTAECRFNQTLGRNIRRELMRSCLPQNKLARALRMAPSNLSRRLMGTSIIYVDDFARIMRYVGTSVDAVITPELHALAEEARLERPALAPLKFRQAA
jgi:transcriptional regulator with XRE-family HTH domain